MSEPTYSYSHDEENYHGSFATPEEAAAEYFAGSPEARSCFVGENETPIPEDFVDASDIIEHIQCQDEFSGEWADGWPGETKEQREELTESLRKVVAEWMDKYDLRPAFFNIPNPKKYFNPAP